MADNVNPHSSAASTPVSTQSVGAATESNQSVGADQAPLTLEKAAEIMYPTDKTLEAKTEPATTEAEAANKNPAETKSEAPPVEEPKAEKPALTLPKDSTLDASDLEKFSSFAKEKGLSDEQAQAVLEQVSASRNDFATKQTEKLNQTKVEWEKSMRADKELGGVNFDKTIKVAKEGLAKYARPEFMKYLETSGLGSAPDMIRTFYNIGLASQNDKVVNGSSQKLPEKKKVNEVMYPNMVHSK